MSPKNNPNRCRLVLITPEKGEDEALARGVLEALEGGDIASIIIPVGDRDESSLQKFAEKFTPQAQAKGIAVIIERDTRVAGRIKADGVHIEGGGVAALAEAIEKAAGRMMIGSGGARTRDDALVLGEAQPDYIFFGRFGFDNTPETHPRNLKLGEWWAEMVSLPCIVLGGSEPKSVLEVAETGADFVAMSAAIFNGEMSPREAVAEINRLLDEQAPSFED